MKNPNRPDISAVMYRFMLYFVAAVAVFLAIAWPIYHQYMSARERTAVRILLGLTDLNDSLFQRQVRELYSDIRVQSVTPIIRRFMRTGREADRRVVEAFFAEAAGVYRNYDQMRLLDLDGNELLRIHHRDGKTTVVPVAELQSKADRYYFKQILRLKPGQIYLSPIDLNVESGRIERPFVPTMRLGTKVLDETGVVRGVILLNYNAAGMLAQFQKSLKPYPRVHGMLLNQGGFWLSDADSERQWAWQLGRPEQSFAVQHPDIWYRMVTQKRGEFRTRDGIYLFREVDPIQPTLVEFGQGDSAGHDDGTHWHGVMAMYVPQRVWLENSFLWQLPGQLSVVLIVLLLALACWLVAHFQVQKAAVRAERARHTLEMERQAHTDVLTGAFNRRHFYLVGARELSRARRIEDPLSLLMLDIDHFKRVNDEHGHDVGDEALKLLVRTCLQQLRPHDLFARTGGEEFAALLPHTGIADAAMVAERIRRSVAALVLPVADGRELRFTVSIGVVQWHAGDADLDALFKRADRKLYQAKDEGRDRVCA